MAQYRMVCDADGNLVRQEIDDEPTTTTIPKTPPPPSDKPKPKTEQPPVFGPEGAPQNTTAEPDQTPPTATPDAPLAEQPKRKKRLVPVIVILLLAILAIMVVNAGGDEPTVQIGTAEPKNKTGVVNGIIEHGGAMVTNKDKGVQFDIIVGVQYLPCSAVPCTVPLFGQLPKVWPSTAYRVNDNSYPNPYVDPISQPGKPKPDQLHVVCQRLDGPLVTDSSGVASKVWNRVLMPAAKAVHNGDRLERMGNDQAYAWVPDVFTGNTGDHGITKC